MKKNKSAKGKMVAISQDATKNSSSFKQKKLSINVKKLKIALSKQQQPLVSQQKQTVKKDKTINSITDDARQKLESARFRYLNEQLYTSKSNEALELFQDDPQSFYVYHKGFQNQVTKWPINPLDIIIMELKKEPKHSVFADFGCGEARLSKSVPNQVHSFDLVASNANVIACDMANVPLTEKSVDVVVFCLSLMGTNINDFLLEANRVLKIGGLLFIAEVESRCQNVKSFTKSIERFGFKLKENNSTYQYFFLAKFTKMHNSSKKLALPTVQLKPCLYKKR